MRGACLGLAAAALALLAGCASLDPDCPRSAGELPPGALYGTWQAHIAGEAAPATVLLQPHPEYAGVRGQVTRGGRGTAQLAGDINDEGLLTLDESADGQRISAVWVGELQARSCGRVFRGHWRRAADEQAQAFTLTRLPTSP